MKPTHDSTRARLASGWPGLIFWLGDGVCRAVGYALMLLAGASLMLRPLDMLLFAVFFIAGHILICVADVVYRMNEKRKRSSAT